MNKIIKNDEDDILSEEDELLSGIMICGWKEDPEYYKNCLNSVKNLNYKNKVIVSIIDGNEDSDIYMTNIFLEVFPNGKIYYFDHLWDKNPNEFMSKIANLNQPICIMQPHAGKRHILYTGYHVLKLFCVPYVLTVDSDTILDINALSVLMKTMISTNAGAVTGDIYIFNVTNFLTLISYLRYWYAFNLERAAQSYWGSVSCVAGPLGLYDINVVSEILDVWYHQKFCGIECTFGDDRHMTNRILSKNYKVFYNQNAVAWTETPETWSRFITQQIRWGKSFIREYIYNIAWFHNNLYLMVDLTFMCLYSYFIAFIIIRTCWMCDIRCILSLIVILYLVSILKSIIGVSMNRLDKFYFFVYGIFFIMLILPIKLIATFTFIWNGWGTGNRRLKQNGKFVDLITVIIWNGIIFSGIIYNIYYNFTTDIITIVCLSIVALCLVSSVFLYKPFLKLVKENINKNFKPMIEEQNVYEEVEEKKEFYELEII